MGSRTVLGNRRWDRQHAFKIPTTVCATVPYRAVDPITPDRPQWFGIPTGVTREGRCPSSLRTLTSSLIWTPSGRNLLWSAQEVLAGSDSFSSSVGVAGKAVSNCGAEHHISCRRKACQSKASSLRSQHTSWPLLAFITAKESPPQLSRKARMQTPHL